MSRQREDSKKSKRGTLSLRMGSYSLVTTAIVIAIVVAVNLVAGAVPAVYTKLDTTSGQLLTLSGQTELLLSRLNKDVTIYWVVQGGMEDALIEQLLGRYAAYSSHIKVVKRDPVIYPNFAAQYTNDAITNNSLIVESGERHQYIGFADIFVTDYSNYYYDYSVTQDFAGESVLTSAVDYVTSENLPRLYVLSGHGETGLDGTLTAAIEKQNMLVETLSLLSLEKVPEDADCVLIIGPRQDISEMEKDMLLAYLNRGGRLMLMTDYPEEAGRQMPNLQALLDHYGVRAIDGIVVEGSGDHTLFGRPYYLLPELDSHPITDPLIEGRYYTLLPVAQGIEIVSTGREGVTVSPLLTTTASAYAKPAGYAMESYEKEEGDTQGPLTLGVAIEETLSNGQSAGIVWLTTTQMLENTLDQLVAGANHDLFLNALGYLTGREQSIAIHTKSMAAEPLVVPSGTASLLSVLMIGVLPAILLCVGIAVIIQRRRR